MLTPSTLSISYYCQAQFRYRHNTNRMLHHDGNIYLNWSCVLSNFVMLKSNIWPHKPVKNVNATYSKKYGWDIKKNTFCSSSILPHIVVACKNHISKIKNWKLKTFGKFHFIVNSMQLETVFELEYEKKKILFIILWKLGNFISTCCSLTNSKNKE